MIKNIFIYWSQKFINAPRVVVKCVQSWKIQNPTWKIIELDDDNLHTYINIDAEIADIHLKNITKTAYSDIVRIFLLNKYGGCWCDATTFCNKPLDRWLYKNVQTGFFAFNKPAEDRLLSSWFIYSKPNNYIISKWKSATILYWNNNTYVSTYFWFHYLFGTLYDTDIPFQKMWDETPKISADGPHFLQTNNLLSDLSPQIIANINGNTPLYKLTYKIDHNSSHILDYLYNTININLQFIHIGKCGGTSVCHNFNLPEYHLERNYMPNNENYIIWIRHPLKRFVSAFNFAYELLHTNTDKLDIHNLSLNNCLAPARIKYKMTHDHTFSIEYDYLINLFKTPNQLAESITSDDIHTRNLAIKLMKSEVEHIYKGIGWYLFNGQFVEDHHNKILFVGSIENMNTDIQMLSNWLNIPITQPHVRENKNNIKEKTFLSTKAISNLLAFYKETDYEALYKLVEFNFIPKTLYDSYLSYP